MLNDSLLIKKAIKLARKGCGFVSPNPQVGAVIVKNGRIISSGFHKRAGFGHAEVEAINKAGCSLSGAVLFVNLEPCYHWGKTPPCVDKIIASGIKEVVISTLDPNPKVSGRSVRKMKKNGIKVKVGILEQEAVKLNEIFFKNMKYNMPFIAVKSAQSLDGKITTHSGQSRWITSSSARVYGKKLRDKYDAVLVGINTLIKDNPVLEGFRRSPQKVIIDPNLKIPLGCNLIKKLKHRLIIVSCLEKNNKKSVILKKAGIEVLPVRKKRGVLDLRHLLGVFYGLGISSIFVEGGAFTIGRFFDSGLVDKIYFFYAPKIIGGNGLSPVGGKGVSIVGRSIIVKDLSIRRIGEDFLFTGYPQFPA